MRRTLDLVRKSSWLARGKALPTLLEASDPGDQLAAAFVWQYLDSPRKDEGGWLLGAAEYIRRFRPPGFSRSAEKILLNLSTKLALHGVRLEYRDFNPLAGKARMFKLTFSEDVQALLAGEAEGAWVFDPPVRATDGKEVSPRTIRRRVEAAKAAALADAADSPETRARIAPYLTYSMRQTVDENYERCVEWVMRHKRGTERTKLLRQLWEVRLQGGALPRMSKKRGSHRLYCAFASLPKALRRRLAPGLFAFDLVACLPTIFASVTGAERAAAYFRRCAEADEDPWLPICRQLLGPGEEARAEWLRGYVKRLVTFPCCGMTAQGYYRHVAQLARDEQVPAELLLRLREHPVIADLLQARDRLYDRLRTGEAVEFGGQLLQVERPRGATDGEYEEEIRTRVSWFLDGVEDRFVRAMQRAIAEFPEFAHCAADLHDGLLVKFRDNRCNGKIKKVVDAVLAAVKLEGEAAGIPMRARLDWDPRVDVELDEDEDVPAPYWDKARMAQVEADRWFRQQKYPGKTRAEAERLRGP